VNRINRRSFMQAAAAAALSAGAPRVSLAEAAKPSCATSPVTLGKTGIVSTLLGMGTGTQASRKSSAQNRQGRDAFMRTIAHAYERGLRYFDMSDSYGAHEYLRDAMREASMDRSQVMLLTKTGAKHPEVCRADIERFRQELQTDYLDIVLLHCMQSGDWAEKLKPCMDVLAEAKEKGLVRAHGVSCHNLDAMKVASEHPWVDVMLSRINPYGLHMDGTQEEVVGVLQRAWDNGKGMIGMKVAGEGKCADRLTESLRYVLGLGCIHAVTVGFIKPEEIDDTCRRVEEALRA